jgi:hypothetical protein
MCRSILAFLLTVAVVPVHSAGAAAPWPVPQDLGPAVYEVADEDGVPPMAIDLAGNAVALVSDGTRFSVRRARPGAPFGLDGPALTPASPLDNAVALGRGGIASIGWLWDDGSEDAPVGDGCCVRVVGVVQDGSGRTAHTRVLSQPGYDAQHLIAGAGGRDAAQSWSDDAGVWMAVARAGHAFRRAVLLAPRGKQPLGIWFAGSVAHLVLFDGRGIQDAWRAGGRTHRRVLAPRIPYPDYPVKAVVGPRGDVVVTIDRGLRLTVGYAPSGLPMRLAPLAHGNRFAQPTLIGGGGRGAMVAVSAAHGSVVLRRVTRDGRLVHRARRIRLLRSSSARGTWGLSLAVDAHGSGVMAAYVADGPVKPYPGLEWEVAATFDPHHVHAMRLARARAYPGGTTVTLDRHRRARVAFAPLATEAVQAYRFTLPPR